MIINIFLYIISFVIGMIGSVLSAVFRNFTIWPDAFLDGLTFFFQTLMGFNIFFPVDTLLTFLIWFLNFLVVFFSYKIVIKVFNFFRGSDSL